MSGRNPATADVGDLVSKGAIKGEEMSVASATAFKKYTGKKFPGAKLVRQGQRIFAVGDAELAQCVYNYPKEF